MLSDAFVTASYITGFATIMAAFGSAAIQARRGRKETRGLRDDLATNHGQRPGEYIEQSAMALFRLERWAIEHSQEDADFRAEMRLWRASVEPQITGGSRGAKGPSDTAADEAAARSRQAAQRSRRGPKGGSGGLSKGPDDSLGSTR